MHYLLILAADETEAREILTFYFDADFPPLVHTEPPTEDGEYSSFLYQNDQSDEPGFMADTDDMLSDLFTLNLPDGPVYVIT